MKFGNPHLSEDMIDILYHLGLDTSVLGDIKQRFGLGLIIFKQIQTSIWAYNFKNYFILGLFLL